MLFTVQSLWYNGRGGEPMPAGNVLSDGREVRTNSAFRAWWLCKVKGYRLKVKIRSDPVPTVFRRIRFRNTWVLEGPDSGQGSTGPSTGMQHELPATHDEPHVSRKHFKLCRECGFMWPNRESLLSDNNVELVGYRVNFVELLEGRLLFNHSCSGMLAFPVSWFEDLYDGPVFTDRLTGTGECPGYCLKEDELQPCPARCVCAFVREIIQIIKNWPNTE